MIFFGWYSFLIKSYLLQDLGIAIDESDEPMQIEIRQKCFHLFWIPFFSLGKMYAIRRSDGKLYEIPIELENVLRSHAVHKTPWYTYIGFLVVAVIFSGYSINEKYEEYEQDKSLAKLHETKRKILSKPIVGDKYIIDTRNTINDFYIEVMESRSDSALLKIVKIGRRSSAQREDLVFEPQWVTTDELLKAAIIESRNCEDSLQLYIYELGGVKSFVVTNLYRDGQEYW